MSYESVRSISLKPIIGALAIRRFVILNASGEIQHAQELHGDAIGVTLEASPDGSQAEVAVALLDGAKMEIELGTPIAAGQEVFTDAIGRAVWVNPVGPIVPRRKVLGRMLESGAVGETVTMIATKFTGFTLL